MANDRRLHDIHRKDECARNQPTDSWKKEGEEPEWTNLCSLHAEKRVEKCYLSARFDPSIGSSSILPNAPRCVCIPPEIETRIREKFKTRRILDDAETMRTTRGCGNLKGRCSRTCGEFTGNLPENKWTIRGIGIPFVRSSFNHFDLFARPAAISSISLTLSLCVCTRACMQLCAQYTVESIATK